MATRKPLIVNASAEQIQEIPSGDSLDGIVNLTCTGTVQAEQITSTDDMNATGTVTANLFVGGGMVPLGAILMWSGPTEGDNVPSGWTLCDGNGGNPVNGIHIPNLVDKFIIGAKEQNSSKWKTNVTGSLLQEGGHKNAVLIGHAHTQVQGGTEDDGGTNVPSSSANTGNISNINATGQNESGSSAPSETGVNKNLPPFYALAYIIRSS